MGEGKKVVVGYTTYPSVRTAARALGISRERLRKSIKRGELDGKPIIVKTAPPSLKSRTLEFWTKTSQALISEPNRGNNAKNGLKSAPLPPARGDVVLIDDYCDNCENGAETVDKLQLPPARSGSWTIQGNPVRSGGGGVSKYNNPPTHP